LKIKNIMSQFIRIISCFLLLVILVSCASQKAISEQVKLERRRTNDLQLVLDSIAVKKPDFFYTKISTSYNDTNRNVSFKTSLRMVKDSAMNLLITYAKIPIVNSIITKDSLTIVNKKDRCLIRKDLGYIKESFGIDFNYKNLEELFLGLPLDYDINQKYFQIHDPYNYILSTHRKQKIKRFEKKSKEDLVIKYFINNEVNHLKGMEISSPSDSTVIVVDYKSRELIDGFNLPKEVSIHIVTPRNSILIDLNYEKSEINQRQPLILVIPEGYEKCNEN